MRRGPHNATQRVGSAAELRGACWMRSTSRRDAALLCEPRGDRQRPFSRGQRTVLGLCGLGLCRSFAAVSPPPRRSSGADGAPDACYVRWAARDLCLARAKLGVWGMNLPFAPGSRRLASCRADDGRTGLASEPTADRPSGCSTIPFYAGAVVAASSWRGATSAISPMRLDIVSRISNDIPFNSARRPEAPSRVIAAAMSSARFGR